MKNFPVTLTIAGSDSGGGAGVQADLKTFSSLQTFGTTVFTCLTAQNPDGVSAIHEIPSVFIEQQLSSIFDFFPVKACKTGMLFSESIIRVVSKILANQPDLKVVVDPVMIATSGAKLLKNEAIFVLKDSLIPLATLITPNLDEASLLLGKPINKENELIEASKELFHMYHVPILLKGGHLKDTLIATDVLNDGKQIWEFKKPFLSGTHTHGTGCTYSSAITAYLAYGKPLHEAVSLAKNYIQETLADSIQTGKITHLNHFPKISNG
jgi:hydroxymethylpyrimidine/phosphomethylpyrimidine kinase